MRSYPLANLATLGAVLTLAGCTAAIGDESSEPSDDTGLATESVVQAGESCVDLPLGELTFNQAVEVSLAQPNAPIVAGRPGLLSVHVPEASEAAARTVTARLTLIRGGESTELETHLSRLPLAGAPPEPTPARETSQQAPVEGTPESASAGGTSAPGESKNKVDVAPGFHFLIPAEQVAVDTEYRVDLLGTCAQGSSALAPLGAEEIGSLDIGLVPVRYDADGSGRTPSLDEASVARLRAALFARFPVSDLHVSVLPPIATNVPVLGDGSGWLELLDQLTARQTADDAGHTYYVGLVQPSPEFEPARSEVYPYPEGEIGQLGYDVQRGVAFLPTTPDMMTACDNTWVSDYTFAALAQRIASQK